MDPFFREYENDLINKENAQHVKNLINSVDRSLYFRKHNMNIRLDTLLQQEIMLKNNGVISQDSIFKIILDYLGKEFLICEYCHEPIIKYNDYICHHLDYVRTQTIEDGITVPVHVDCHKKIPISGHHYITSNSKLYPVNTRSDYLKKIICNDCLTPLKHDMNDNLICINCDSTIDKKQCEIKRELNIYCRY